MSKRSLKALGSAAWTWMKKIKQQVYRTRKKFHQQMARKRENEREKESEKGPQ